MGMWIFLFQLNLLPPYSLCLQGDNVGHCHKFGHVHKKFGHIYSVM